MSERISVDITTLSGWDNWFKNKGTPGAHKITVKAKASGYLDSSPSEPVTFYIYEVAASVTNCESYAGITKTVGNVAFEYTFVPKDNYDFASNSVTSVTIGSAAYTGYTFDASTGKLTIPAEDVTGQIIIRISAFAKGYSVNQNGTHVSMSADALFAYYGTDYTITLTPNTGYNQKEFTPTVTIGGNAYTGFTWDWSTGKLTIPGEAITGDIIISATAEANSYVLQYNAVNGTITAQRLNPDTTFYEDIINGATVFYGDSITWYAEATPGYMTMQGEARLPETGSYSFNVGDDADSVVMGDTTIVLNADFKQDGIYGVTYSLTSATLITGDERATHGTNYVATINPETGYNLPASPTVTIGGKSYTGFTWNAVTGSLTIPGADVTGAIVITVEAELPPIDAPQNVSIDGTVVSWDKVDDATSYNLYAGGLFIGNTADTVITEVYTADGEKIESVVADDVEITKIIVKGDR